MPFVAKATGQPLAQIAARLMAGETLAEIGLSHEPQPPLQTIKEAVLPFRRFLARTQSWDRNAFHR